MERDQKQLSLYDGTKDDIEELALELIHHFAGISVRRNPVGYVVGYSGGKDSEVLVDLFIRARERWGVKFIIIHNHTGIDAPETVYFIRKKFKKWREMGIDCRIYLPEKNFWHLSREKGMLPTRIARFCCEELKERNIPELAFATHAFGVRKTESVKRAMHRDSIETRNTEGFGTKSDQRFHFDKAEEVKQMDTCYTNKYFIVNPIAYWTEDQVWNYIHDHNIEYNPLYDMGFDRVGCIGCPMAGKHRQVEFARYPKYEKLYRKLADDIFNDWKNGNGVGTIPAETGGRTSCGWFWVNSEAEKSCTTGGSKYESSEELWQYWINC